MGSGEKREKGEEIGNCNKERDNIERRIYAKGRIHKEKGIGSAREWR